MTRRPTSQGPVAPPDGAIECWQVDLDRPDWCVDRLEAVLAADERERAARFVFGRDRRRFVVARACLRALLARACGLPARDIRFHYGPHGKPALDLPGAEDATHFNVSHSGDLALIGLTRDAPLGIDVEMVRPLPDLLALATRYFSPGEASAIREASPGQRELTFFLCWTRKEAFVKATGDGLALRLDRYRVACRPGEPARILDIDGSSAAAAEWTVYDLAPRPGYVGAVVMRGAPRRVSLNRFELDADEMQE